MQIHLKLACNIAGFRKQKQSQSQAKIHANAGKITPKCSQKQHQNKPQLSFGASVLKDLTSFQPKIVVSFQYILITRKLVFRTLKEIFLDIIKRILRFI